MAKKPAKKRAPSKRKASAPAPKPAPQPAPAPQTARPAPEAPTTKPLAPAPIGRPYALDPTPEVLLTIAKLGQGGNTYEECAAWFGVTKKTWIAFLARCPEALDALEIGKSQMRMSLRRKQLEIANKDGHKAQGQMLIWLGKQYLEQKDQVEATGAGGSPLVPPKITVQYVSRAGQPAGPATPPPAPNQPNGQTQRH